MPRKKLPSAKCIQAMSVEELDAAIAEIDKQAAVSKKALLSERARLEALWLSERRARNLLKIRELKKHPETLKAMQHDRTSCSDRNPCNGWDGERARCVKCHLMEILEEEDDRFEVSLSADIHKSEGLK